MKLKIWYDFSVWESLKIEAVNPSHMRTMEIWSVHLWRLISLGYLHEETTSPWLSTEHPAKTQSRLNMCLGSWPASSVDTHIIWTASSEFGTYRLCEQRRFRRACASAQSRQNLRCSLIQAVNQEEPSDRKSDPWLLWMAGHAQLKFVITECSETHSLDTAHIVSFAMPPLICIIEQS